jgi:hypothetical protein
MKDIPERHSIGITSDDSGVVFLKWMQFYPLAVDDDEVLGLFAGLSVADHYTRQFIDSAMRLRAAKSMLAIDYRVLRRHSSF